MSPGGSGYIPYESVSRYLQAEYRVEPAAAGQIARLCDQEGKGYVSIKDVSRSLCEAGPLFRGQDYSLPYSKSQLLRLKESLRQPRPAPATPRKAASFRTDSNVISPLQNCGQYLSEKERFRR